MSNSEQTAEIASGTEQSRQTSILLGVTGVVDMQELQQRVLEVAPRIGTEITVAYPGSEASVSSQEQSHLQFRNYALPAPDLEDLPWTSVASARRVLFALAVEIQADICVLLHSDLLMLRPDILQQLIQPILEGRYDLALPVYPSGKFENLLNHSVLAPLSRSLYGSRVKYPLPQDLCCSADMCATLSESQPFHDRNTDSLIWPAMIAAVQEKRICQVNVDAHHGPQTDGLELRTALASLMGSAYVEMERYAAFWQRVRSTQMTAVFGAVPKQFDDGDGIDVKPMVESFQLGTNNLQEVWRTVLPPVILLELKKLTRLNAEDFRMPDSLWVRIIYDFALAHRLRVISRSHLLGALTPLYLGWVASYVQEVSSVSLRSAEQRLEQLARAYEENKPYLLQRWRWPDRFNP